MPALSFRCAVADDIPALVALVESAYRGDASRAGWTTEADLLDGRRTGPEEIDACISRPRSVVLIAELPTSPVFSTGTVTSVPPSVW